MRLYLKIIANKLPLHYGWVVVSLCILGNMVGAGTTFWTMAVYIPLIADEFQSTRTAVVSAFTVGQITFVIIAPFIGTYFDRKGVRGSIFIGSVLAATAFLLTSQAETVFQIFLGWTLLSATRGLLMDLPFNWLITRWFVGKKQQAALGVVTVGFGFGGAILLPILNQIASVYSWRASMITSAILLLIVHGFLIPLLIRNTPQQLGLTPNRSSQEKSLNSRPDDLVGMTVSSAVRTPAFWVAAMGLFLFYGGQTLSSLIIDFFSTAGLSFGALAIAITAWIRTGLRIPLGFSMARIDRVFLLSTLVCLSQGLGVFALLFAPTGPPLLAWILLWGIGGAFAPMVGPLVTTKLFGVKHYGAVSGAIQAIGFSGQMVAPILGALLFDIRGDYYLSFMIYSISFALGAILFAILKAPKSNEYKTTQHAGG
jgi:MFS family permease